MSRIEERIDNFNRAYNLLVEAVQAFDKDKQLTHMAMHDFGLPQRTIDELFAYFKTKPDIEKVLIFGSRAKGNFHNGSDIDFAIWSDNSEDFFRIAGELDELPTPYKFDVIDYKNLSHQAMKNSIDKDGKLFYQR